MWSHYIPWHWLVSLICSFHSYLIISLISILTSSYLAICIPSIISNAVFNSSLSYSFCDLIWTYLTGRLYSRLLLFFAILLLSAFNRFLSGSYSSYSMISSSICFISFVFVIDARVEFYYVNCFWDLCLRLNVDIFYL